MPLMDDDVNEIKRETVETHNLIIKTDNLIKNLSAEIRQIQKKQEGYEKKYLFNSVVSYVLFVILIFAGLYIAFDAKIGVERREKEELEKELKKARSEAEDLQNKLSGRAQQEKIAEHFLRLRQDNRDVDALKAAEGLDLNVLSPLMARLVGTDIDTLKAKVGERALEEGKALFLKGELERSLRILDRAVEVRLPPAQLAKIQNQRGIMLTKLNRNAPAALAYLAAADADPKAPSAEAILFSAATALETSGDIPRALEVYSRLLVDFPNSAYTAQAKWKIEKFGGVDPTKSTSTGTQPGAGKAPAKPAVNTPPPTVDNETVVPGVPLPDESPTP